MTQILVFGDSITYGSNDREGGWVQKLREFIDEKMFSDPDFECYVYNLGISGAISEHLINRIETETKPRLLGGETIFIFSIGVNDSEYNNVKKRLNASPEGYAKNIQKLINESRKFSKKIIFLELTPVDEPKVDTNPWDSEYSYKNKYVKQFNQILKSVCEKNNVYFVELPKEWKKSNYKKLLGDGLHPTPEGHRLIFEAVKLFLIEKKLI